MRDVLHLSQRKSTAVAGADQCSYTGTRDDTDRNIFLFQNFEDADMRNATGKASTQSNTNGRDRGCEPEEQICGRVLARTLARTE